jgi:hypothetical protein
VAFLFGEIMANPMSVGVFGGMAPIVDKRLLDPKFGQKVVNALNTSGKLSPLKEPLKIGNNLLPKPGVKKSMYRFGKDRGEDEFWFHWTFDVNVVRGSINDDTSERTYFTGDGVPKYTNSEVATGTPLMPSVSYTLGIPKPDVDGVEFSITNRSIISISAVDLLATVITEQPHQLKTNSDVVISGADEVEVKIGIESITKNATTVTVITTENHTLATGDIPTIHGATDPLYNVSAAISVTSSKKFTYTVASEPAANADGDMYLTIELDAFNGKKTATVVDDTTFTYPLIFEALDDATGTIEYNLGGLDENRVYALAFVGAGGEEGAPAIIPGIPKVTPGQELKLNGLPGAPAGAYNIAKKRLYRSQDGTSGASLRFVSDLTLAQDEFIDRVLGTSLGETIPTLDWEMPPDDMLGLISYGNGMMAAISKNQVLISVPYQPHAWPIASRYSFNTDPIALGSFGQSIVVLTAGQPSILDGSSPDSMSQNLIKYGMPCLSAKSVVEISGGVMWACKQGLAFIDNQGFRLITAQRFNSESWAKYAPNTIRAYRWENRYVGFYDTGAKQAGFYFDLDTGDFYELDYFATAGFTDERNSNLYLAVGNDVFRFNGGANNLPVTWLSKEFTMPAPINPAIAKVVAEAYPVTFKLFAAGVLKNTKVVQSNQAFALPAGYKSDSFEVQLETSHAVKGWAAAETVRQLAEMIE